MSRLNWEVCVSPLENKSCVVGWGGVGGVCIGVWERWGGGGVRKWGPSQQNRKLDTLTGAHVEFRAAHAVVSGRAVVQTLPVLPHPFSSQKEEEFGLAVYTAVVPGAHWAAFTDGVGSIASCRTSTEEKTARGLRKGKTTIFLLQMHNYQPKIPKTNFLTSTICWRKHKRCSFISSSVEDAFSICCQEDRIRTVSTVGGWPAE